VKRPPGYPLLGHPHFLSPNALLANLRNCREKYGPVYEMFLFGNRYLILNDIESVKEVLTKRPKVFRRDKAIEAPFETLGLNPTSLFIAEGSTWSRLRRLMSSPFNKQHADNMTNSILDEVSRMIKRLNEYNGKELNANAEMMQYTLSVIANVALGNFSSEEYFTGNQFMVDTNILFDYLIERAFFPFPQYIWNIFSKFSNLETNAIQANQRLDNIVKKVIAHSQLKLSDSKNDESRVENKSFIDMLLSESSISVTVEKGNEINNQREYKLTTDEVVANIKTVVLAGSETTSVTLSWTLYHLSLNPHLVEAARVEIDSILPNIEDACQGSSKYHLPFVHACFKETLRLCGPAPFVGSCK
jgi:cytochrome P450